MNNNTKIQEISSKIGLIKHLIFAITIFIGLNYNLSAQIINNKGTQVILKGEVRDFFTNAPVSCELQIKTESGSKMKIKSNSITGAYEQLFNVGEKITVTFSSFDILKQDEVVVIKESKETGEQIQNFKVKQLVSGKILESIDAFGKNEASINQFGKAKLEELKLLMRFNRSLTLNLVVSSDDSFQSAANSITVETYNELDAKGKKKSKKELDAMKKRIAEQNAKLEAANKQNADLANKSIELSNKRKSEVEKIIATFAGMADRLKVTINTTNSNKQSDNDLFFTVDKVENKLN